MNTISGVGIALASLLVFVAVVMALGLPWALAIARHATRGTVLRHALWWGLAVLSILALIINQFTSLGSTTALIVIAAATITSGILGGIGMRTRTRNRTPMTIPDAVLGLGLIVVVLTLSLRVLGPVTNYDTGLYHLGAIAYAEQFAAIPGLANIYFAYGYATSQFPLAAVMSWTPLGSEGFRALNAGILILAFADLWIRIRSKRLNAGTTVLAAGLSIVVFTMLPLADYWVISPTQDASVFILTVVAGAYLSEALSRKQWIPPAATALILAGSAVLIRTTMLAFFIATCVAVLILALRKSKESNQCEWRLPLVLTIVLGSAGFIASGARDYILSGWLMYPLSILPFSVDWRAPDPTPARMATLGAARDPENLWMAADSWSWIPHWFANALRAWELWALVLLLIAVLVAVIWRRPSRALALALLPSAGAAVFWFVFTPPSFRFAWGPLFTLGTVTLGWVAWQGIRSNGKRLAWLKVAVAAVFLPMAMVTLALRIDFAAPTETITARWLPITFAVAPITTVEIAAVELPSGLPALVPTTGDQCWDAFPVCSPQLPPTLALRGETLQEGLLP